MMPNRGELPQYFVQDDHEGIVDRDTFLMVQIEMARRKEKYDNEINEQQFELLCSLENSEAVTRKCLRYFDEQDVTAIPIVSCSSMGQLMECIGAFR